MMEFVNGKDDISYMKWKIKFMFETTNQGKYLCELTKSYQIKKSGQNDGWLVVEPPENIGWSLIIIPERKKHLQSMRLRP